LTSSPEKNIKQNLERASEVLFLVL